MYQIKVFIGRSIANESLEIEVSATISAKSVIRENTSYKNVDKEKHQIRMCIERNI
jgi:hypothetical protein